MGELQYPGGPGVDDERQYRAPFRRAPQYRWPSPQAPQPSAFAPWRRAPAPPRPPDYRRSASYPGKPDETFQERSGLDNMRSLEHYLTDIMRADTSDHMKGKSPFFPGVEDSALASGAAGAGSPSVPADQAQDVVSRLSAAGLSMCVSALGSPARSSPVSAGSEHGERFSRKVFVGGLPPDIDEDHVVVPAVRAARGGLAAQGGEQELLPAQGIRLPALPGRELRGGADGGVHHGRRQAVPVRVVADDPRQARADPAVAARRRGLRARRQHAAGPAQDRLRRRRAAPAQGRGAGDDHGPAVRRRVLRRHRHRPRAQVPQGCGARGVLQPAVVHRGHIRAVRAAAARRHRQARRGEAVRAGRPDVRRVRWRALRLQVRALLLRQRHLPPVLLRALLGHDPLAAGARVPQAAREGGRRPAARRALPLVLV